MIDKDTQNNNHTLHHSCVQNKAHRVWTLALSQILEYVFLRVMLLLAITPTNFYFPFTQVTHNVYSLSLCTSLI